MTLRSSDHITWKSLPMGVVLLNLNDGAYHVLNETGSLAWRGILDGKDRNGIVEQMLREFDCAREEAEADVDEFLQFLENEQLVVRTDY